MNVVNSDPHIRKSKRIAVWLAPVAAGSFALAACGGGAAERKPTAATASTVPAATSPAGPGAGATITFDSLGSTASSIIEVFPGVKDTPQDRLYNGTFKSGQTAEALCKTAGREVTSDPSAHERPVSTNIWVQIMGSPGETQYATLTYADISAQGLAKLPACPSPGSN